jgi:hypothetical protein
MRDPTFALIEHHRACAALAARTGQQRQEMEDSLGDPWGRLPRLDQKHTSKKLSDDTAPS